MPESEYLLDSTDWDSIDRPRGKFYCVAAANGVAIEFYVRGLVSVQSLHIGIVGAYWQHPHFASVPDESEPHLRIRRLLSKWLYHESFGVSFNSMTGGQINSDAKLLPPEEIALLQISISQSTELLK